MITINLTEAEAAEASLRIHAERTNGSMSIASGRAELIHEASRDEALGIVRRIEQLING